MKARIIKELVYSASGRFSACETQQDFIDQQRLYEALLTERIDELLAAERERCARIADDRVIARGASGDDAVREGRSEAALEIREDIRALS